MPSELSLPCLVLRLGMEVQRFIHSYFISPNILVDKSFPATGLDMPLGLQEVEAPEFLYSRHVKVVSLSALRTGNID